MPSATSIELNGTSYDLVAGKLSPAVNIDGVIFDGSADVSHYGVSDTAAGTADKTVQIDGFELSAGARVSVKFTNANSADGVTLNVSGTGAKSVVKSGSKPAAAGAWEDNEVVNLVYDGTNWNVISGKAGGGGEEAVVASNDVDFFDYDGTILYSYSAADFANLSSLPENPSHKGLTSQGWNWTLSDAKAYVAKYNRLDIGQMYITADGKTKVYISVADPLYNTFGLTFRQSKANGVVLDWGDGSETETFSGTGQITVPAHTYNLGKYVITFLPDDDCTFSLGYRQTSGYTTMFGNGADSPLFAIVEAFEMGKNASVEYNCFYTCCNLERATLANGITELNGGAFSACARLKSITVPSGVTTVGSAYLGSTGYGLKKLSLPMGIDKIPQDTATNSLLTRLMLPEPTNDTTIKYAFYYLYSASRLDVPENVTQLGSYAIASCVSLKELYFHSLTPPAATSTFQPSISIGTQCVIYVPAAALEDYKSATNYPDPNTYTYIGY